MTDFSNGKLLYNIKTLKLKSQKRKGRLPSQRRLTRPAWPRQHAAPTPPLPSWHLDKHCLCFSLPTPLFSTFLHHCHSLLYQVPFLLTAASIIRLLSINNDCERIYGCSLYRRHPHLVGISSLIYLLFTSSFKF